MTDAYPLAWPEGWPRAKSRTRAKFGRKEFRPSPYGGGWNEKKDLTIADGTQRVTDELRSLGVRGGKFVISSNLELRNDGLPRSGQRAPDDPGVAVYWQRGSEPQKVMAIDIYDRVADNLAAIAATLYAMRAIERHGGAQILERAFTGFDALPAPDARDPFALLGLRPGASAEDVRSKFRELARSRHPDAPGGSKEAFQDIEWARQEALRRIAA